MADVGNVGFLFKFYSLNTSLSIQAQDRPI